jgi:protein O-mannosyl-transferase
MSRNLYIPVLLALLVIGVYLPVRSHEFVNYDDPDYVTANLIVQQGLTERGVAWAFGNVHGEKTYWHPLTWISHMLDVQWFGLNAGAHHLVNVFWHTLNVVLLFIVLLKLTSAPWRSAAVAALFAFHPLQVDTVAWITERKNLLSTFFCFLVILAYLRFVARPTIARNALVFVLFALGLMTKPAIVTLPCLLLLLDFWPLRRWRKRDASVPVEGNPGSESPYSRGTFLQLLLEKIPLFALSAASSYLTIAAHQGLGMIETGSKLSIIYRIENAIISYGRYIWKTVWPTDLAVLYPHPGAWPRWQVIACGALLLLITDRVLRLRSAKPYLMTGWFWFLGMLVPAIGIVQVGTQAMADRFVYVPIIGLFIAGVWLVADIAQRSAQHHLVLGGVGAAAIIACIVLTSIQLRYWKDSITLMSHTAAATKDNFAAYHNWGVALIEKGRIDEATVQFQHALQIKTNGYSLKEMGRILEMKGQTNEALAKYMEADRVSPEWVVPRKRAIVLLMQRGDTNTAFGLATELIQRAPRDPEAHYEMGAALESKDPAKAMAHYLEAMKINRNHVPALTQMAWLLSTHTKDELRSGQDAVGIAEKACVLSQWKHPRPIVVLSAALAEIKQFPDATNLLQQAMNLTKQSQGNTAPLEKMMAEFQAGKPHRE